MKVAVFGKPGVGKSTLSQEIAKPTGLPLHHLDRIQFVEGGGKIWMRSFSGDTLKSWPRIVG
jgi:adenylate kinase family enzyme